MAASTGPILAVGGIVVANQTIFNGRDLDWRIPIATGIAAAIAAGAETVIGPAIPRAIAVLSLVAVTLSRVDPSMPSPAESALTWWKRKG